MIRCLGCGKSAESTAVPNAEACACGSRLYHEGEQVFWALPPAFALLRIFGLPIPMSRHIEDTLGRSRRTSKLKRGAIQKLLAMGMVWAKDCPDCKGAAIAHPTAPLKPDDGQAAVEEWERMLKGGGHAL